jgi:hypothetical protein
MYNGLIFKQLIYLKIVYVAGEYSHVMVSESYLT